MGARFDQYDKLVQQSERHLRDVERAMQVIAKDGFLSQLSAPMITLRSEYIRRARRLYNYALKQGDTATMAKWDDIAKKAI